MAEPVLRITSARKRFGAVEALAGLSLSLGAGEWVGLLGPNGAGKSTLMHAIAGLLPLDAGRLELFGHSADRIGSGGGGNDRLGFVPQEIALYPLLTTEQNLQVFGRLHGLRRSDLEQQVTWALQWTGLAGRARTCAGELSGGMKRRLNIACGVLHRPQLVLLDEPTVGVDPQGRQRIWEMLTELRQEGAALIQSTHELDQVETRCDRMLILDHGQIIAAGAVDELIAKTLGGQAVLHLQCDQPLRGLLSRPDFEIDGNSLRGALHDVAIELPAILAEVHTAGLEILGVHVERPSLESVFTHLTGRELRE